LPVERRQKLLGFTQRFLANSANQQKSSEAGAGANVGQQLQNTNAANVGGSTGGMGSSGGVPPAGTKLGFEGGLSASNSAGSTAGVNTRAQNAQSQSQGTTQQDQ